MYGLLTTAERKPGAQLVTEEVTALPQYTATSDAAEMTGPPWYVRLHLVSMISGRTSLW
jgi:hypothetical protein